MTRGRRALRKKTRRRKTGKRTTGRRRTGRKGKRTLCLCGGGGEESEDGRRVLE